MTTTTDPDPIPPAIALLNEAGRNPTGGQWLETLTAHIAPHIREWDIARCWRWPDWPERDTHFPGTTQQDIGIDAVAVRRSDGQHIAIQCKARQLDEHGRGADIHKAEIDKFAAALDNPLWAERWVVTNGDNRISGNTEQVLSMRDPARPIKLVNIHADLTAQQNAALPPEPCPHCAAAVDADADANADANAEPDARQTKSCMQDEAVADSVRILREHARSDTGGAPVGQARGKIILPCGAGKTRISLRIVEELTPPGNLSIVLCPSIALVAQLRREYLQHAAASLRALAVCSDATAGYDPRKEGQRNTVDDPTADTSNVSAAEVKGQVTTNPDEIAAWIQQGPNTSQVSVIFGTYQSGRRIADALQKTGVTAQALIADEAHRTAGLRRKRARKPAGSSAPAAISPEEQRIRDFTLCHDHNAFPAVYRIYQTATPRIYDTRKVSAEQPGDWIVRSMDDEATFGVELYRKSYQEAVRNGWLADYRIIALGINDPDSYAAANLLAANTRSKGRRALTTADYLRGLTFALAMGGATRLPEHGAAPIKSCIAFMNTVDKSRNMADDLQTPTVRRWLQDWMAANRSGQPPAPYTLEHLDAASNVATRENAKRKLADAAPPDANPHGIINVGIFGEGTDSPTLNAVAFLEARKSPIDVIQAVGRAMRTAPGKQLGYIICPILIPPNVDPEQWLSVSSREEGWQELGQILLALRAHDQRIEDNLADLMHLYLPKPAEVEHTMIAVVAPGDRRIHYGLHAGPPGAAQEAIVRVLEGETTPAQEFQPLPTTAAATPDAIAEATPPPYAAEPAEIMAAKQHPDGTREIRGDTVARGKPKPDGTPGPVDYRKSKAKGGDMINKGAGVRIPDPTVAPRRPRRTPAARADQAVQQALRLLDWEQHGNAITVNLLAKSGLTGNRVLRDLNILEAGVREAARHLDADELRPDLDRHFGLDHLDDAKRKSQADGGTIAALLLMNAAMLHQRIANGRWLPGIASLDTVKNDASPVHTILRQWHRIIGHDFKPVLEPAVRAIETIEDTGKTAGLQRALRHLAAEAERIAETYADMGADHAGPLFNRVMGNQASDGAFFTRPVAAAIAARLTLDVAGETTDNAGAAGPPDWTDPQTWQAHKTVDLACGSGTLLAALLADLKRRARRQGATDTQIDNLQTLAVEETIKGMDINPISLQLAASQLTTGNHYIGYRRMGLHLMPYGPQADNPAMVSAGSLELLGQQAIVPRPGSLGLPDDRIAAQSIWPAPGHTADTHTADTELRDAVDAAQNARIVIMNPPFTNRAKMGEKFPKEMQQLLRQRVDAMEQLLIGSDSELTDFVDKNTIRSLFVALADKCLRNDDGVLTMVTPTVALCAPSGENERRILAQRYHIHTVLTGRWPREFSLSHNVEIDESLIVATRGSEGKTATRFVHLDKMPVDEPEVDDLHQCLTECSSGAIANGWGEVSYWPAERIAAGDWTPAIWRSPELAEVAARFANDSSLKTLEQAGLSPAATGQLLRGSYERAEAGLPGSFPILKSKGNDAQTRIQSQPDEHWIPKNYDDSVRLANGGTHPRVEYILEKAGYLLITAGQDSKTGHLTATADDKPYVGNGWMPVTGLTATEAKALAVFINSTPGRLQLMRHPGRKIPFPTYSAAEVANLRIPDVRNDARARQILADCWQQTKDTPVPQFRDGECQVRQQWDDAVARALNYNPRELTRLRRLLHQEPHIRGLGYNQHGDAAADAAPDDDDDGE